MKTDLSRVSATWVLVILGTTWLPVAAVTVNTTRDELDTPAGSAVSLREAIRDTAQGGTINFSPALNGLVILLSRGEIEITKNLRIDASSLGDGIILDGAQASRILSIYASTTSIDNLTFRKGSSADGGGAIHLAGTSNVTLNDCELLSNTAVASGAAISCDASSLALNRCRIAQNTTPTGNGGGIALQASSTLVMENSTVSGNRAGHNGGGIYASLANSITVRACTIDNNSAVNGAGIYALNTTLNLTTSTFSANSAGSNAGAIYATGDLDIESCTIADNHAVVSGGGLILSASPTRSLRNTIIAKNSSSMHPDIFMTSGGISSGGGNVIGDHTGSETQFPEGLPNGDGDRVGTPSSPVNPLLAPLARYGGDTDTMHPLVGSPVINAGVATALATDQRGLPKISGTSADSGAVETGIQMMVTTATDENDGALGLGSGDSLRECIQAASGNGDHIQFDASLSGQTILLSHGQIDIFNKSLCIDASSLPDKLTINADSLSRIFHLATEAALSLHSVNLTHGLVNGISYRGGGIRNEGSQLSIVNSVISENKASGTTLSLGGAIYASGGILHLIDCTLNGNSAHSGSQENRGGAVALAANSRGYFTRCIFIDNQLHNGPNASGAGLYSSGDLTVKNCTFRTNKSNANFTAHGGGIYTSGIAMIRNSTFASNMVSTSNQGVAFGGAIAQHSSSIAHLENSTFSGNSAENDGGALHTRGEMTMVHCSVANNTAINGTGGGLRIASDTVSLENNILANNTAGSSGNDISKYGLAILTSNGANLIGDNETVGTEFPDGALSGTSTTPLDPLLADLGDYGGNTETLALRPRSPAFNAAITTPNSPSSDQRSYSRPFASAPDLGSYEAGHIVGYPVWTIEKLSLPEDASFTADPESDTNMNGLEYATGGDPLSSEGHSTLVLTREAKPGGGYEMHITFPYEPSAPDVKYVLQRGTNLSSFAARYRFTPATGLEQLYPTGQVSATRDKKNKTITVVDDGLGNGPHYFWRLQVELLP